MSQSHTHWLVAVPNEHGAPYRAIDDLATAAAVKAKGAAEITHFKIPLTLKIGTLDSLMLLSDDLARGDASVESVVKKLERQVHEAAQASADLDEAHARASKPGSGSGAGAAAARAGGGRGQRGGGAAKAGPAGALMVNGVTPANFMRTFEWDKERFDSHESLVNIANRLTSIASKADADVRTFAAAYAEKKQQLAALARAQTGALTTIDLTTVLTPETVSAAGVEFLDSEYLSTQVVILHKSLEQAFLDTYEDLDEDSVPLGPEGDRESVRGSPVVPNSAVRVLEDKDGYVLYTVVILVKFEDSFRADARARRFVVRPFKYDPVVGSQGRKRLATLEVEVHDTLSHLLAQASRKFSDAFTVWMHLKAVRVFVESVLRYGLPVNFVCALVKPTPGHERKLTDALRARYAHLGDDDDFGDGGGGGMGGDDDFGGMGGMGNAGAAAMMAGMTGMADSFHPFVFVPFSYEH